jgi:acyl carrier protein
VTGDTERLPTVVTGLLRSQVATDLQAKLGTPDGTLRLREDLGVDSLALTEIGILAEDVLQIAISDVERRGLRTLGDLINLMACKTPVSAAVRTSPGL